MSVKIIVDSASDIKVATAKEQGLLFAPLKTVLAGVEYSVINAVRNTQCPEEEIVLNLRQIEKNATYEFDCPETSETFTMKGSDLLKNGLHVNLPARYGKFFFYKKVNG